MDQEGKAGVLPKLIDFPLPFHCFPPVCAAFLLSLPFVSRCAAPTPNTAAVLADSDRAVRERAQMMPATAPTTYDLHPEAEGKSNYVVCEQAALSQSKQP